MKHLAVIFAASISVSFAVGAPPQKETPSAKKNVMVPKEGGASMSEKDWEAAYQRLLKKEPGVREKVESGGATKAEVIEWMKSQAGKGKSAKRYSGRRVEVKDPAVFRPEDGKVVFSGPQPGEKLLPLSVIGMNGRLKDKKFDPVAVAKGKPQVLIFQDQSPVGVKGLYFLGPVLQRIQDQAKTGLDVTVVFLGDDQQNLKPEDFGYVQRVTNVFQMSRSPDGRDGPGNYGLNRKMAVTIVIARDGKVAHNFTFATPMLYADPHILGAVAEVIGEKRETVSGWLSAADGDPKMAGTGMTKRGKANAKPLAAFAQKLKGLVKAGKLSREEAIELYQIISPDSD